MPPLELRCQETKVNKINMVLALKDPTFPEEKKNKDKQINKELQIDASTEMITCRMGGRDDERRGVWIGELGTGSVKRACVKGQGRCKLREWHVQIR